MMPETLGAAEIASRVTRGDISAADLVEGVFRIIEAKEGQLNALITPLKERARKEAEELDRRAKLERPTGALSGVPVVIKDNMCTEGIPTTCGSKILEGWKPPYDAWVVRKLREAGAVIVAKSNMDEFAMGSSTEHSAYGAVSNPWDIERVPGGSSGGSAASVSAGYVPVALGSDTGGSIRQPAAFCGVYGLKPTYGLVSRFGLVAFASSLDQIGPFARNVEDLALVLSVISPHDPQDSTCVVGRRPGYVSAAGNGSLAGLKVGIVPEFFNDAVDQELVDAVRRTADIFEDAGASVVDVRLPNAGKAGLPCYYIIAPAEASSNLARYDGIRYGCREDAADLMGQYLKTRGAGLGSEVKRRILTGTYVLSSGYYDAYYLRALKVRRLICREFDQAFEGADVILMPTTPSLPFRKGELVDDPVQMYMSDVFTLPVNLAGLPGLSVYAGTSRNGLPLGVQIVAPRWEECRLLQCGRAIENALGQAPLAGRGDR
ncbi:MAG: Asp-tRNA(Asn)/Glu-tRNA(Gln) amidotransferase subunit GatA [Thermovirgaceae bacterium]